MYRLNRKEKKESTFALANEGDGHEDPDDRWGHIVTKVHRLLKFQCNEQK